MTNSPTFTPFKLQRGPLLSADHAQRIYETARQTLAQVGLQVQSDDILQKLAASGLRHEGKRVYFDPLLVDETLAEIRHAAAGHHRDNAREDDGRIHLNVSSYCLFVHDTQSNQVLPYTSERLIEMTKFLDSLADNNVSGTPPGIPVDVHPDLQPVAQYYIAALYARQGATPVDPTSPLTARFMLDIAEVMGQPMTSLPVYLPTPLRLGGESLAVVLACIDRLESISVSSMPSAGTSAPLQPFGALALAAAEVLGGVIAMQRLTHKPVHFGVGIFPSDLREGSMVFGSPENMLFQMLCSDFNHYLYGLPTHQSLPGPDNLHVMAKLPDCQSAAEKAAILITGAAQGTRHFSGAGALSLDEIFSPEQLLVDCEIRDWAQRAIQGVNLGETEVSDWVAEIQQGLSRGYLGLDSTLDHYREQTWYPRWFRRGAIGPWMNDGQAPLSTDMRAEVQRRVAAHNFELDPQRRKAVEKIYQAARRVAQG
jgi:trimethylamine--corrinoid protein Co-methyltransferase